VTRAQAILAGLVLGGAGALGLLSQWEPDKRDPGLVYADQLAAGLPTVCNGITRHVTTTPLIVGERWPAEKCEREERAAIEKLQVRLLGCFVVPPPQSVLDAATSHAWNVGVGNTCGSAAMHAWSRGAWRVGCGLLQNAGSGKPVWSYVSDGKGGHRFVQGLYNRRGAEKAHCLRDVQA
jgi:lysozyme